MPVIEATLQKTADWLLSWVYDVTDGQIQTGQDHVNIIPHFDNWEEKMMNNDFICGWYVRDYNGVTTRIATDTVAQEHADKNHAAVEKARKAAMEYWNENNLSDDYGGGDYCERCDEYVGDIDDHNEYYHPREYCEHCDEYYNPNHEDHSDPYCEDCERHVYDLDQHNREYHFEPEPWMPKEESTITYQGKQYEVYDVQENGVYLVPLLPGGLLPYQIHGSKIWVTWDEYKKDQQEQKYGPWTEIHPEQTTLENPYPGWIEPKIINGVPTTPPPYWKTPSGNDPEKLGNWNEWQEVPESAIIRNVDLYDDRVFARLASDFISQKESLLVHPTGLHLINNKWSERYADDSPYSYMGYLDDEIAHPYTGLTEEPIGNEITYTPPTPTNPAPTQEQQTTPTQNISDISQIDDPRLLAIEKDPDSDEYRWSYDGRQLHIWRVFNRKAYGPSHYDMFGMNGYENHSQGRVYVSPAGKVGVLYWQISHPECEQVLNEWVMKTFGHMPDYVYRAYGPYAGEVRPRWSFPIVEVSGLPISPKDRWWEMPGGSNSLDEYGFPTKTKKKDYPAKKQKSLFELAPGPVDDEGQPVNPSKAKRRRRTRNRKYRNRNFRKR